ncbi:MAG: diguanylate cyclase, partial [Spirochaetia bacterium]
MNTILSQNERSTLRGSVAADKEPQPGLRVTGRIARLPISTKLLIGYLAFVFPVAVLLVFMVSGFGRDMTAVRLELGGIEYAGRVLELHQTVSELQVTQSLSARDLLMTDQTGKDPAGPIEKAIREIDRLEQYHQLNGDALGLSTESLTGRGLAGISAPTLIRRLRANMEGTGRIETGIAESLRLLSDAVLNLTGVTQDSALDSNALIRAVLIHLPEMQRFVGDALVVLASYGGAPNLPVAEMTTTALEAFGTMLRNSSDRNISTLVELAIREDSEYFGEHRDLQALLRERLGPFLSASSRFVVLMALDEDQSNFVAGDVIVAGIQAWDTSAALFEVGLLGIRILVEDRLTTLRTWRMIAVASSASALLVVALLVLWISRSISRSVNGIIAFTRKVAEGDHAARLQIQLPEDLYELYGHTRSMIDDIATMAEFPRQNPNGVLAVGPEGEVIYRNPSVLRFMEERGLELEKMLPATHRDVVDRLMHDQDQGQCIETSGEGYVFEWSYYPVKEQELVHLYCTDITERKRAEEQLIHDSFHDSLTELPNRALFTDRLQQTLSALDPDNKFTFAVFFIDLDRFKVINESLGPDHGDELLKIVADRLMTVTRPQDTVARFGGDEFAVLLPSLDDSREALHIADRIHEEIRKTVSIRGEQFTITCSIGIVFPGNDRRDTESIRLDPQAILRDADSAMYSAKASGKARSEIFHSAMYESALAAMRMETELIQAVKNGEITAYYQPIISLKTGRIAGFEALARWRHPDKGLISPGAFIPLAEETGLIIPIGALILREAVEHICAWHREHPSFEELVASVNLSVRQFGHPALMDDIRSTLDAFDMKAHRLKLEITESGLMENVEASLKLLTQLKELGITLAIDDFGTG